MPAKIDVGLQSVRTLGKSIVYGDSISPDACKKHHLWRCRQPRYLGKASSMGIQSAQLLAKSIVYEASVSPDT